MCKARNRWAWTLAAILWAPLLLGATYRWIDAQGQVHFTDSPPPAGIAYEIVPTSRSSSAPPSAPFPAQPVPVAPEAVPEAAAESPQPDVADTVGATTEDMRCVDALFQLDVLAGDWKVYKPGPGNDRTYLNDRDRPAEIKRFLAGKVARVRQRAWLAWRGHCSFPPPPPPSRYQAPTRCPLSRAARSR